ncbi:MAG: protein-L-isoaspartate(D-aspartate) O-methyltransferase [Opitutales bacterium]
MHFFTSTTSSAPGARRKHNQGFSRLGATTGLCLVFLFGGGPDVHGAQEEGDKNDRSAERRKMAEEQIEARGVEAQPVLRAMREVPRHLFVPSDYEQHAYEDRPLPIGHGQTISQPYIVAAMTEALELRKGHKVLEVGTGSGYQAAVLAEIVDSVSTIEIIEALAEKGRRNLEKAGYHNVDVRHGDGFFGWEEKAPFDAIIVTAAPDSIPPPLLKQLKPGGRMVIPVGSAFGAQRLLLVRKEDDGSTSTKTLMPVNFVPFTREER